MICFNRLIMIITGCKLCSDATCYAVMLQPCMIPATKIMEHVKYFNHGILLAVFSSFILTMFTIFIKTLHQAAFLVIRLLGLQSLGK